MNHLKTLLVVSLASFLIVMAPSCNKEEDDKKNSIKDEINEDTTARILANSLSYNSYGTTAIFNYIASESKEMIEGIDCDGEKSNSNKINYTTANGLISTNYDYSQNCSKTCSPNIALHYATIADHITKGGYFKTENNIILNIDLSGFEESSQYFLIDGTYTLDGLWEELATQTKIDIDINTEITNSIKILKSENPEQIRVTGGTMNFVIKAGLANSFVSTELKGTITYLSDLEARIDFDNGGSYEVNLKTGGGCLK